MKVSSIIRHKWFILLAAILYRYYLDLSYTMLTDTYPVEFPLKINAFKMLLSYLVICVLILITYKKDLVSLYLFRILTFFTIIPISSVYAMKDESSIFFFLTCLTYGAVQILFINAHNERIETDVPLSAFKSVKYLRLSFLFLLALTTFLMYVQLGIPSMEALILENVYEIRQDLNITNYVRYLLFICAQVIVPFGIAEGYVQKNWIQIVICILFQLLFFLWTGNKTWFFSILLILAIMVLLLKKINLDYFFVGLAILCAIGYYGKDSIVGIQVGSLLNRRVLLDPAALKFSYYDYFIENNHDYIYFSSTILGPLISGLTKADGDYTQDISGQYTDKASNAITGIYGGDIANWGWFAFILVPIFLYVLASLAEKSKYRIGSNFTYLFLVYIFFLFNDHRIVSYFLDFQGIVCVIILYLMSKKRIQIKKVVG